MILYTQNVCPKCMLVKDVLEREGTLDRVEIVNLDEKPESREILKEKGFAILPILQVGDEFYLQPFEIIGVVNS